MFSETIVVGRLGSDPEMRYTAEGQPFTHISVATEIGYGDNKKTVWYRCTIWGKQAESANQYLHKGDIVAVTGQIQPPRIWTGQDGTPHCSLEMSVQNCRFVWTKREGNGNGNGQATEAAPPAQAAAPAPAQAAPASATNPAMENW